MPLWQRQPSLKLLLFTLAALVTTQSVVSVIMRFANPPPALLAGLSSLAVTAAQSEGNKCGASAQDISLQWNAPANSPVNNLPTVINGTGTNGFIFNTSQGPPSTYNYCNMPHVSPTNYKTPPSAYKLEYVEVIHRHHKRTPYADNTFPQEAYPWSCSDQGLFYGGKPLNPPGNGSADTYWAVYTDASNPFPPQGFNGTCQFPQITRGGLDDSHQHGVDLKTVYADKLSFLPSAYDPNVVEFRVTNNVITSQVASMLIAGLYPALQDKDIPLKIQPASIDSLEPTYSCPYADSLFSSYGPGSGTPAWRAHLTASADLKRLLDTVSGVSPSDGAWSRSYDHYFDSLSSRLCHDKPLPCNVANPDTCITTAEANEVLRLGEYEYSFIYRDSPDSLAASRASFGVWIAELAAHLRAAMSSSDETSSIKYRHNVAHDGSVSRLLSILQLDRMVWPGMGAEVVFELYSKEGCYFVRVLWGGEAMVSSHPAFGAMDMIPVEDLLAYFDGLAGVNAVKRLSPELRNNILSLALVEHEAIEIKKERWPEMLETCRQLREEGMPVYLGNNIFTAQITDDYARAPLSWPDRSKPITRIRTFDTAALDAWLQLLRALPAEWKKLIDTVTMHCECELLDFSAEYRSPTARKHWIQTRPNFTFWYSLVSNLKAARLTAQQLVWPGVATTGTTPYVKLRDILLHTVNKHVLTPVLADPDMLDSGRPPVCVTDSMRDEISAAPRNSQEWRRLHGLHHDTKSFDRRMSKETLQDWKTGMRSP